MRSLALKSADCEPDEFKRAQTSAQHGRSLAADCAPAKPRLDSDSGSDLDSDLGSGLGLGLDFGLDLDFDLDLEFGQPICRPGAKTMKPRV